MRSNGPYPVAIAVWTSVVFAAIGCTISVIGPTLLDLAARLSVDNDVLASIFPVRAVGGFIGTAASGFVFDRFQGHSYLILCVSIVLSVTVVCLLPLSVHTAMLGVIMFFFGFCMQGFLINVGQSTVLRATQRLKRASSYILFLHFSYAVGATLSPLWARSFVSKETQTPSNLTCREAQVAMPLDVNSTTCSLVLNVTCRDNSSYVTMAELKECLPSTTPSLLFGWAYWLCAPIFLTGLAAFLYYSIRYELRGCCRTVGTVVGVPPTSEDAAPRSEKSGPSHHFLPLAQEDSTPHSEESSPTHHFLPPDHQEDAAPQTNHGGPTHFLPREPLHVKIIFFVLLSLFVYTYVGIEAFFTNYIFTFSVESGTLTKDKAAILNSLFWAIFALFRFFSILLALVNFPSALLIVSNISVGFLTSVVLAIFPHEVGVVWSATAVIGACMSSTFPSIVAWLSQQTEVTGKTSALLICLGAMADMTMPITVATLMTRVTPLSFVYLTAAEYAASITMAMILFVFTWSRKRLFLRGQGKGVSWKGEEEVQLTEDHLYDEEEEGEEGEGKKEEVQEHTQPPASVPREERSQVLSTPL